MEITPDSEVLRLEKRQRGLQRVATAINDLTIYGIYPTNFPKLVSVLEHAKDHVKAEIISTKSIINENIPTNTASKKIILKNLSFIIYS